MNSNRELEDIRKEMKDLQGRLETLGAAAGSAISDSAERMSDKIPSNVKEYAAKAIDSTKETLAHAKDNAKEGAQKAQKYAEENPWHVAGAAAIIGMAVAFLIGRRNRD